MAPFPFSFWASYENPSPTPTPTGTNTPTPAITPTPTKTPAVSYNYLITCDTGVPGDCPGGGSVVIGYYEKVSGLLNSITLTGIQINAGYTLCARNYPSPPIKTSGASPISITQKTAC